LVLVVLSTPTGCARLYVKVAVLDKEQLDATATLRRAVDRAADRVSPLLTAGAYARERDKLLARIKTTLNPLIGNVIAAAEAPQIVQSATDTVTRAYDEAEKLYHGALERLAEARALQTRIQAAVAAEEAAAFRADRLQKLQQAKEAAGLRADRLQKLQQANSLFVAGDYQLLSLSAHVRSDLAAIVGAARTSANTADKLARVKKSEEDIPRIIRDVEATAAKVTAHQTLFSDPDADLVVYAPDRAWRGKYNVTYGAGYLGNTDIAVRMESADRFTLKGVRLDTAKVAAATFGVLKDSLRAAAAAYGIPLPGMDTKPAESTGSSVDAQSAVITAERERLKAQSQRRISRYAVIGLLEAIAAQRTAVTATTRDVRVAAIETIKRALSEYRPMLAGHAE
jgi:hypothetical protein